MFTHFATADSPDESTLITGSTLASICCQNSPYVHGKFSDYLWHRKITANTVRMGISMYGQNPSGRDQKQRSVTPVGSLFHQFLLLQLRQEDLSAMVLLIQRSKMNG